MTLRRFFMPLLVAFSLTITITSTLSAQPDTSKKIMARGLSETHAEGLQLLNSASDEATPFVSADESTLYFSTYRDKGRQPSIYRSQRKSVTEWGEPQKFIELPGKEGISALSMTSDGHTVIVQCCNRSDANFSSCDIYSATIENGTLTNLRPIPGINTEWWEGQPFVSKDGQLLFFSSDRKGGQGGSDLYMCTRNASGDWSSPVGLSFNTSANEVSPFISADNQTLYFATDASGGQGGFDIYVTYRKGDNEWTQPKNLGPSVNTNANELFFFIPPVEDAVYISSDRQGGAGNFDLYKIMPNPIKARPKFIAFSGRVLDAVTNQPITAMPDVSLNLSSGEVIRNLGTPQEYKAEAPLGKMLRIKASADGYANGSVEVQIPGEFDEKGFTQDIKLTPAQVTINGHTTDLFTKANIVGAKVTLEEVDEAGNSLGQQSVMSDANAAFSFQGKVNAKYRIAASATDYQGFYQPLEVPVKREGTITVTKEIRMTPADIKPVTVNFDYDKSDLLASQMPLLTDFIKRVKGNPYVKLEVQGYTDERGSEEYNKALSERRAKTVQDYLLSKEVPADQLAVVKGYGKSNPLDPSSTEEAFAKNRRVEIRIVGK
jgi:outer membrane protein OmpA-like peptidoglycan-associated protein